MKIQLLTSVAGAVEGSFGEVKDLPEDQARQFIRAGWAKAVGVENTKAPAKRKLTATRSPYDSDQANR